MLVGTAGLGRAEPSGPEPSPGQEGIGLVHARKIVTELIFVFIDFLALGLVLEEELS